MLHGFDFPASINEWLSGAEVFSGSDGASRGQPMKKLPGDRAEWYSGSSKCNRSGRDLSMPQSYTKVCKILRMRTSVERPTSLYHHLETLHSGFPKPAHVRCCSRDKIPL